MGKHETDWFQIERDYRAGIKSLRQVAAEHSITEGAIRKRAKRDEWSRDLRQKIRQKADELVRKEVVRTAVRTADVIANENSIVSENAEVLATEDLSQRQDVRLNRDVINTLLVELKSVSGKPAEIKQLIRVVGQNDPTAAGELAKVLSLPSRITAADRLTNALAKAITLQRVVLKMDEDSGKEDGGIEAFLKRIGSAPTST